MPSEDTCFPQMSISIIFYIVIVFLMISFAAFTAGTYLIDADYEVAMNARYAIQKLRLCFIASFVLTNLQAVIIFMAMHGSGDYSTVSAIKCQVCYIKIKAVWLINRVQLLVCSKSKSIILLPYMCTLILITLHMN